jgi:hypothetical protein
MPMQSTYNWTTADTVSMVLGKLAETTLSGDSHLVYVVRVVSGDGGTIRGVIGLYHATSTEIPLMASAATRIHSVRTNGATTFTSQVGDRIIIEIGVHGVTPALENIQMRVGDPTATDDFALTSGLTTDLCSWVELSRTVSFIPEPSVSNNVTVADTPITIVSSPQILGLAGQTVQVNDAANVVLEEPTPLSVIASSGIILGEIRNNAISSLDISDKAHTVVIGESLVIAVDSIPIPARTDNVVIGSIGEALIPECITDKSDSVGVGESLTMYVMPEPSVNQISKTDDVVMTDGPRYYTEDIIVCDSVNVFVGIEFDLYIVASDNVNIYDHIPEPVENVTVGDLVTINTSYADDINIWKANDITLGESLTMSGLEWFVSITDDVIVAETSDVYLSGYSVIASDGVTLGETSGEIISDLNIPLATDSVFPSDDGGVFVTTEGVIEIQVGDSVTSGETIGSVSSDLKFTISNSVVVGDPYSVLTSELGISDKAHNVVVGESVSLSVSSVDLYLSVDSSVTVSELPPVVFRTIILYGGGFVVTTNALVYNIAIDNDSVFTATSKNEQLQLVDIGDLDND